jgi:hypothetical protein
VAAVLAQLIVEPKNDVYSRPQIKQTVVDYYANL